MGPVRQFLGIEMTRDQPNRVLYLTQKSYIDKIIAKFGGSDLKLKDTPWPPNFPIPLAWEAIENETKIFRQHVGCVNWLATYTRPDVAFAVGKLAKVCAGLGEHHIRAVKHLL